MIDYTNIKIKQGIIKEFKATYSRSIPINIIIVTYNRLPYLQKCIASIHGATSVPYNITVIDDGSIDGTVDWLKDQKKRDKICMNFFHNRRGTAENFNVGMSVFNSEWVVIVNDDMYFHRWWDFAGLYVLTKEPKAGTVTVYDYTNNKVKLKTHDEYFSITGSGLGAAFIRRQTWDEVGKFVLSKSKKMGFFASPFCARVEMVAKNNLHFLTNPSWAHHMDLPTSDLSERDVLEDYIKFRQQQKRK